jgi:hypothetical protein
VVFSLLYTNECGADIEHEFEAPSVMPAIAYTLGFIQGNEGLWAGIYLIGEDGEISPPGGTWF